MRYLEIAVPHPTAAQISAQRALQALTPGNAQSLVRLHCTVTFGVHSWLQVSLHDVFDASDFLQIFGWLEMFIKHPVGQDDPPFLSGGSSVPCNPFLPEPAAAVPSGLRLCQALQSMKISAEMQADKKM